MIPRRPAKSANEFISGAKAEQSPEAAEDLMSQKDKTFLLRMPYKLWLSAKKKAGGEGMSLHDYILRSVNEAVTKS